MYNMPLEIQNLIYEFDNTYRDKYNNVISELNNKGMLISIN